MLRVLPPTFKPVNNLICCKTGSGATSLFNLFCSNVARQVARFSVPLGTEARPVGLFYNLNKKGHRKKIPSTFFLKSSKQKNGA